MTGGQPSFGNSGASSRPPEPGLSLERSTSHNASWLRDLGSLPYRFPGPVLVRNTFVHLNTSDDEDEGSCRKQRKAISCPPASRQHMGLCDLDDKGQPGEPAAENEEEATLQSARTTICDSANSSAASLDGDAFPSVVETTSRDGVTVLEVEQTLKAAVLVQVRDKAAAKVISGAEEPRTAATRFKELAELNRQKGKQRQQLQEQQQMHQHSVPQPSPPPPPPPPPRPPKHQDEQTEMHEQRQVLQQQLHQQPQQPQELVLQWHQHTATDEMLHNNAMEYSEYFQMQADATCVFTESFTSHFQGYEVAVIHLAEFSAKALQEEILCEDFGLPPPAQRAASESKASTVTSEQGGRTSLKSLKAAAPWRSPSKGQDVKVTGAPKIAPFVTAVVDQSQSWKHAEDLDLEDSCDEDSEESKEHVPQYSVGSALHASGRCRPCAFLYTKGCGNGSECEFCHLCGPGEKKKRRKEKMEAQRLLRRQRQSMPGLHGFRGSW
eukprot:TRINITY_DN6469_c1_g1_i1.p1 TRINITY_DN6469_c1_g1~~TRINITY_DN6469_c1_g1_i1.p1  ORF type:complete len:494 (-),score=109.76 TRINITY_DN6469_c1_g1_i1:391-1872(-)